MLKADDLAARFPDADQTVVASLYEAALEAIAAEHGELGDVSEYLTSAGDLLMLSRPAQRITSIKEHDHALAADDYELRSSGRILRRLVTGTTPSRRWRGRVDVTYAPLDDENERDRVAAALIENDLTYAPGIVAERIGDWMEQHAGSSVWNYQSEREAILGSFASTKFVMA